MSMMDKIKGLLSSHKDTANSMVDKAGDMLDSATKGQFSSQVDMVQDQAKKQMNNLTDGGGGGEQSG